MNQKITFFFLVATVVAVGIYFFRIVQPFLLPLLMAGTLALLVQPWYQRVLGLLPNHRRLAAMAVTIGVVLLIVLPTFLALGLATNELLKYGGEVVEDVKNNGGHALADALTQLEDQLTEDEFAALRKRIVEGEPIDLENMSADKSETEQLMKTVQQAPRVQLEQQLPADPAGSTQQSSQTPVVHSILHWFAPYLSGSDMTELRSTLLTMARALLERMYEKTAGLITNVVRFVIGLVIMLLGLYYLLAEGPQMARELEELLPFDSQDEVAVVAQFETLCRGVVLGTLAAAVAQAALVGAALGVLDIPGAWLLTFLTVVIAMVPFVGASGVYVPVAGFLLWEGRYAAAVILLLYGFLLVSTVDNLIRAHVVHGTSRLHPLVALISALGALQLVGLWGIFVGPIVAGIFYSLLKILQRKLAIINRASRMAANGSGA